MPVFEQALDTQALLVFCEGPHDVAFCKLIFGKLFQAKMFEHKFADFPAPLNSPFKTQLEQHLLQDMSLDMAHKFFLPDAVFRLDKDGVEWLILLFNCGGKNRVDNPKAFLANYLALSEIAKTFPEGASRVISQSCYLFLYDVDDQQPQQVIDKFSTDFAMISGQPWISQSPQLVDGFDNAATVSGVAVYMWAHEDVFTLEDIVLPLFQQAKPELTEKTAAFVDDAFEWPLSVAAQAKRKKAIIATLGQKKKPGSSMNVILEQSQFIETAHLNENIHVQIFVSFLTTFLNLETAA